MLAADVDMAAGAQGCARGRHELLAGGNTFREALRASPTANQRCSDAKSAERIMNASRQVLLASADQRVAARDITHPIFELFA